MLPSDGLSSLYDFFSLPGLFSSYWDSGNVLEDTKSTLRSLKLRVSSPFEAFMYANVKWYPEAIELSFELQESLQKLP